MAKMSIDGWRWGGSYQALATYYSRILILWIYHTIPTMHVQSSRSIDPSEPHQVRHVFVLYYAAQY
jgi:hypothetical protein